MTDYLIIGQGIAGTMLAYFLERRGIDFAIADVVEYNKTKNGSKDKLPPTNNLSHPFNAASYVSTGIINPITGRRFVKSWMIDELFPFAEKTYLDIEKKLRGNFYKNVHIYRTVPDQKAMTDFLLRLEDPDYQMLFSDSEKYKPNPAHFEINKQGITIKKAAQLNVAAFVQLYRNYLIGKNRYLHSNIDINTIDLKKFSASISLNMQTQKRQFKNIIFCEGYRAQSNPYFNFLPFTCSNGETITFKSNELQLNYLLKSGIFIIPKKEDTYIAATTWNWDINQPKTTSQGYENLKAQLNKLLKVPFQVVNHQAAVRPTIKDRRPVLGVHPIHKNVFIFNGLGSKGVSLAPYFAQHFVNYMIDNQPLIKEISINRFIK